ncbi:hypothetical protein ABT237_01705 [Streptomyces sp. NPDC001581]|uniref:hypothetical protein n=1 Tax=Streptomyces sp. NPDC001581 TaxID=3154386 RepID=UPI00333127D3
MSTDGLPLAGTLTAEAHAGWSPELRAEFAAHAYNGQAGGRLLGETDRVRVRVRDIRLAPGERPSAHRHVLDCFWTAVTAGARPPAHDGTTREVTYQAGPTRHFLCRSPRCPCPHAVRSGVLARGGES